MQNTGKEKRSRSESQRSNRTCVWPLMTRTPVSASATYSFVSSAAGFAFVFVFAGFDAEAAGAAAASYLRFDDDDEDEDDDDDEEEEDEDEPFAAAALALAFSAFSCLIMSLYLLMAALALARISREVLILIQRICASSEGLNAADSWQSSSEVRCDAMRDSVQPARPTPPASPRRLASGRPARCLFHTVFCESITADAARRRPTASRAK